MGWVMNIIRALATRAPKRMADPEISRLFLRMEELRTLDYGCDIYGARTHRYKCGRMSHAELARLEADLGVELPDQCRRWLIWVGKGAGPGHGLACENADYAAPVPETTLPTNVVRDVRDLTPEILRRFDAVRESGAAQYLFGVARFNGLLHLCEHGCGAGSLLIAAGPFAGRVIDDWATTPPDGVEATFMAGRGQDAEILPTFFEWLEDWVDSSIEDVDQARSRRIERHRSLIERQARAANGKP